MTESSGISEDGPNREQVAYWNGEAAEKWVRLQDLIDAQIRPFGEKAMDAAALAGGESVLDIGCGCGQTTMGLSERVGPQGRVIGLDVSRGMLAQAGRRAVRDNVTFVHADAQTHPLAEGEVDVLYSRFGVMFFVDPVAAFANLGRAVRSPGRLAFVAWRPLQENPWMLVPLMAAAEHIALPAPPRPDEPGPFAFGDAQRVRSILESAGWGEVQIEPFDRTVNIAGGAPLEEAVDFLVQMGPVGRLMNEIEDGAKKQAIVAAIAEALRPYETADGVCLDGAAWIVTARR